MQSVSVPRDALLWPWSVSSLEAECSARPRDTIHVAFKAIRLVARGVQFLDYLLDEVLMLQLSLRLAKTLQTEWKPTKRVQDVLYSFGQFSRGRTMPTGTRSLEIQFYQHGGFLALAALGLAINIDQLILKDLGRLNPQQLIPVIESIEGYLRHPSVDAGLEQTVKVNSTKNIRFTFFSRSDPAVLASKPRPCALSQPILEQRETITAKAPSANLISGWKRQRGSSPDAAPRDSPRSSSPQLLNASYGASESCSSIRVKALLPFQRPMEPLVPHVTHLSTYPTLGQAYHAGPLASSVSVLPPGCGSELTSLTRNSSLSKANTHSVVRSQPQLSIQQPEPLRSEYREAQDVSQSLRPGVRLDRVWELTGKEPAKARVEFEYWEPAELGMEREHWEATDLGMKHWEAAEIGIELEHWEANDLGMKHWEAAEIGMEREHWEATDLGMKHWEAADAELRLDDVLSNL